MQRRDLPHDFPPFRTCYGYFAKWQQDRVFTQLTGVSRSLSRQEEGKQAEPSACVIDAQSVKTSTSVPTAGQGTDAAKKIVGRTRSIVADGLGPLLAVLGTAASSRSPSPAATASPSSSTPPGSTAASRATTRPSRPAQRP